MKRFTLMLSSLLMSCLLFAQSSPSKQIESQVQTLLKAIETGDFSQVKFAKEQTALSYSAVNFIHTKLYQETDEKVSSTPPIYSSIANQYPISSTQHWITLHFISFLPEQNSPQLLYELNLIGTYQNEELSFSIPLPYLTRNWKSTEVDHITYHHVEPINLERAKKFAAKNKVIADKLGVEAESFDFYMCPNRQEIAHLLGFQYSFTLKNQFRDGYGVVDGKIFSVMNNEDFSHDVFHYYSSQIHERKDRNWVTEEGLAYSWGNAYYTDKNGEMVNQDQLIKSLQVYLSTHPESSPKKLFYDNAKIFQELAPEASARSVIAGIILSEIEKKKGIEGIISMITCGRKDKVFQFMTTANSLIGLNNENFNNVVLDLLSKN